MTNKNPQIAIIGGGAAGLFAGAFLKQANVDFLIFEKGTPGRKLQITGHGRCNITNLKNPKELKLGYHEAGNFLYPALNKFAPEDTVNFLNQELKILTKQEDNNRIFPISDKAKDISDGLTKYIGEGKILTDTEVTNIYKEDGKFVISVPGDRYYSDIVILAAGGASFPKTGSDGSSFKLAENLGHKIEEIKASLAPIIFTQNDSERTKLLEGISIKNASIELFDNNKKIKEVRGDILFTSFGITGPAPMFISREIPLNPENTHLVIDYCPDISEADFIKIISENPKAKVSNLISKYVPKSMAESALGDDTDIYARDFTKDKRKSLVENLKRHKYIIQKPPRLETAYVTRGGVCLKEVDRNTMKSKIVENLYIIGETLDVDGISGGYNLQAGISTAHLAVSDMVQSIK